MSFRIHAAGSDGFRYTHDNQADDDVFEAAAIISALNASGPSAGGAVEGAADYMLPSVGILDGVQSVASMTMMHSLRSSVDMLGSCSGASRGWISVAPREESLVWADTSSFARYEFYPGDSAGSEFIRMILPALSAANFNNYGTFRSMALALSAYYSHIGNAGRPMIQIQLTH
jgi:hypothetical protein